MDTENTVAAECPCNFYDFAAMSGRRVRPPSLGYAVLLLQSEVDLGYSRLVVKFYFSLLCRNFELLAYNTAA